MYVTTCVGHSQRLPPMSAVSSQPMCVCVFTCVACVCVRVRACACVCEYASVRPCYFVLCSFHVRAMICVVNCL